ncbi:trypsin-like peptidase domain-containing protein [Sphingomonas sp. ac-8]|uniref:S1 family peptidase n=1 Tax=Sphingomonas sp. ac-8 TaxID=3242977 RepID=UPI003A7FAF38
MPLEGATAAQAAICRPEFTVDKEPYGAGTAFVVNGPRPLLVTAHHLFGEMGGLDEEIRWNEMPARATAAHCAQIKGKGAWTTGPALAIAGAHPVSATSTAEFKDIAVFPLVGQPAGSPGLVLAEKAPATGSKVWLVAQIRGGNPDVLLHRATVVEYEQGAMLYAFDDKRIELQATSGAPIVDAEGRLVGINLAGTTGENPNDVLGVADSLDVVRKTLSDLRG